MKHYTKIIFAVCLTLITGACVTNFAPGFYTPQLTEALPGKVKITTFKSNQPELTKLSTQAKLGYDLNDWLSEFFTDASMQEFTNMEAYDDKAKCVLSGHIPFYKPDMEQSRYRLEVEYQLTTAAGKSLYKKAIKSERAYLPGMSLTIAQTQLHRVMTENIAQLVRIESFQGALKGNCFE